MNQSKYFPDCFYRVTVKGLCVRDGKLLMVKEEEDENGPGIWELPGGGLDFGEDIDQGLRREVEEEMGLKVRKISGEPIYIWTSKVDKRRNMDWYHVLVLAYQVEFEDLNITPSRECKEIGFFTQQELSGIDLGLQLTNLPNIFNPEDFKTDF